MGRFSDILAGQRFDWRIRLIEKADRKNPVIDERFAGTELEAEHRLTDFWNACPRAVFDSDRRYKATLPRVCERKVWMTIES